MQILNEKLYIYSVYVPFFIFFFLSCRYSFIKSNHTPTASVMMGEPCFENPCSYEAVEKVNVDLYYPQENVFMHICMRERERRERDTKSNSTVGDLKKYSVPPTLLRYASDISLALKINNFHTCVSVCALCVYQNSQFFLSFAGQE